MRQRAAAAILAALALLPANAALAAVQLRLDVAARTEAGSFYAPVATDIAAFGDPRVHAHRLTIPLGGTAAAEVRFVTRILAERDGNGVDIRFHAFAETVGVTGADAETEAALAGTRAVRRERFTLDPGTSRIIEMALVPSNETAGKARLRFHLILTREPLDEARAFVLGLAAPPAPVEEVWRIGISARRARAGEETLVEAIELWARSGTDAAYRHEQTRADGGVVEYFDLRLEPVEEEGAVALVVEAKGTLLKSDGSPVVVDRRDVHAAGSGVALALRYGETNAAGMLIEGMAFNLLMERVRASALVDAR